MTQTKWDSLTPAQRDAARDTSKLHPALVPLKGYRVEGTYCGKRQRFIVGQSTGWVPCTLGMRSTRANGSSDVLTAENFTLTRVIERVR